MKLRPIIAAACLACAAGAQAQIYKCVDARGTTHYSDKPLRDCKGAEVDIRGQEPISGKLETYGTDVGIAEREFAKRQQEREREQQAQAKADEERRQRCARMKETYQRFINMRRVPAPGPNGERDYLDAAARDAKTAEMESIIARDCR